VGTFQSKIQTRPLGCWYAKHALKLLIDGVPRGRYAKGFRAEALGARDV